MKAHVGNAMRLFVSLVFFVCSLCARGVLAEDIRFVTLDFSPFIYGEAGKVAGPGRDLIAAACDNAELSCSYDIFPWRRAQDLMKNGEADGMMVIGLNPGREEWLDFSPPLFRTEYGFFVGEENALDFSDLSQVAGYRVGVFAPSNTAVQLEALRNQMIEAGIKPIEIDQRPDDVSGFRKLAAGRLDAVYSNRDRGNGVLAADSLSGAVRYAGADKAILYYAAIRKSVSNSGATNQFFAAVSELYASGRAQEIIEEYNLEPAPQSQN